MKWCLKTCRISFDPLATVSKPNPELDRRLRRRILLPDEWPFLLAAGSKNVRYGVSPLDRPILYGLAIQTGYRAEEIRELQIHNVASDKKQAWVTLRAEQTKNRLPAKQFITIDLYERVLGFIKATNRTGSAPLFQLCNEGNMSRMIKADLAVARQDWIAAEKSKAKRKEREASDFLASPNFAGETFDFHSLRHTCGAWLSIQGIHPKTIQSVMRHSTIKLTLDTYGHFMPGAETSAIELIGSLQKR